MWRQRVDMTDMWLVRVECVACGGGGPIGTSVLPHFLVAGEIPYPLRTPPPIPPMSLACVSLM